MEEVFRQISVYALPILLAVILHEVAHGWVAYKLGDPTAKQAGRLTLNPLAHIDPVGTILVPLLLVVMKAPFLIGWAKPVPVTYSYLRDPKRGMLWVALAGPATNLLLAILSAAFLRILLPLRFAPDGPVSEFGISLLPPLAIMARNSLTINVLLAVFNALPILPLDGGRILAGILPPKQAILFSHLEPFGFPILLLLLTSGMLNVILFPIINGITGGIIRLLF